MKKALLLLSLLLLFKTVCWSNVKDSTWYRDKQGILLKYVMLPANWQNNIANINLITLQYNLFRQPEEINLNIEIYNVLYKKELAVFSVMPSYKNTGPFWSKIDPDTVKDRTFNLKTLKDYIDLKISQYPTKARSLISNLKFWNFVLIIKRDDGWYCSTTDCFTEFFKINNDTSSTANKSYQINLTGKLLSVAEYESAYRRKHGYYSTNTKSLNGFNDDVANGDLLYHSFTDEDNSQKKYHFWLLSEWAHDGNSAQRGMDRFVFDPQVGVISASYDFFMPAMVSYWNSYYNKKFGLRIDNKNIVLAGNKGVSYPGLDSYFTEYTIPVASAKKK